MVAVIDHQTGFTDGLLAYFAKEFQQFLIVLITRRIFVGLDTSIKLQAQKLVNQKVGLKTCYTTPWKLIKHNKKIKYLIYSNKRPTPDWRPPRKAPILKAEKYIKRPASNKLTLSPTPSPKQKSTNSAKTLKIFNVYSSLGLQKIMSQFFRLWSFRLW